MDASYRAWLRIKYLGALADEFADGKGLFFD